jgi:signal transduction histidine kinase
MRLFGSIKGRLIALHLIAVFAVSLVLPLALYWRIDENARTLHERALREQAEQIARYLSRPTDGNWSLDLPDDLRQLYSTEYGRYGFAIVTQSGQVLFSTRAHGEPLFRSDPRADRPGYFERNVRESRLFGASVPLKAAGETLWVQVSQDQAHRDVLIDDIVAQFLPHTAWVIIPILLVLVCIDLLIFGRALKPLVEASTLAERISPARTDLRLPEDRMPREVAPLVRAVNGALDRLERGFITQREFLADAAHELRTPLAILRAEAEGLADRASARALLSDIEGMARMVNQLIDIAEYDSLVVAADDRADLHSVCAEVASFMAPVAIAQGKSIAVSGAANPVWVHGNRDALFHAVRNLVENAIAHTAPSATVDVSVTHDGKVAVRDEGPGVPADQQQVIFQRFWRGDRRRADSAGLGLAIVSRIVKAHGGQVKVDNAPLHGAVFSISLRSVDGGRRVTGGP